MGLLLGIFVVYKNYIENCSKKSKSKNVIDNDSVEILNEASFEVQKRVDIIELDSVNEDYIEIGINSRNSSPSHTSKRRRNLDLVALE